MSVRKEQINVATYVSTMMVHTHVTAKLAIVLIVMELTVMVSHAPISILCTNNINNNYLIFNAITQILMSARKEHISVLKNVTIPRDLMNVPVNQVTL